MHTQLDKDVQNYVSVALPYTLGILEKAGTLTLIYASPSEQDDSVVLDIAQMSADGRTAYGQETWETAVNNHLRLLINSGFFEQENCEECLQ